MRILHVVGARPNFVKAAPVISALRLRGTMQTIVHTGQHYDAAMSDVFFDQFRLPAPDINLEVGSGSHAFQTAAVMSRLEPVVLQQEPDVVLVYGDVNSTLASALVCAKLLVPVVHVEAGLRSGDRSMPEEVNRIVTDQLSNVLFTPSRDAGENLLREGISASKIKFVGNVMIDTLTQMLSRAEGHLPLDTPKDFALLTLHRPATVDDPEFLRSVLRVLADFSEDIPIVFPVHPRTRQRILAMNGNDSVSPGVRMIEPLSYLAFLALQRSAKVVITDSGGIQEETTFLGVPCLTLRDNTERPITTEVGTNVLVGRSAERLAIELRSVLTGRAKKGTIPEFWDGRAAERIASALLEFV